MTAGYYSPLGVNTEFLIPGGWVWNGSSLTECTTGYYSDFADNTCHQCPIDYACPYKNRPLAQQINCLNTRGYYQPSLGQTECTICPAGSYCPYGANTITACPAGYYSLGAAEYCHQCPAGYACPDLNKPTMIPCLLGEWSGPGQATCTVCTEGYECFGVERVACAANKYSDRGVGICRFLDAGFY